jgi:hypothetical protein
MKDSESIHNKKEAQFAAVGLPYSVNKVPDPDLMTEVILHSAAYTFSKRQS